MKKMGVLLPTRSQLPSSVYSLTAKPRGSRAVSAEPFSPPEGLHGLDKSQAFPDSPHSTYGVTSCWELLQTHWWCHHWHTGLTSKPEGVFFFLVRHRQWSSLWPLLPKLNAAHSHTALAFSWVLKTYYYMVCEWVPKGSVGLLTCDTLALYRGQHTPHSFTPSKPASEKGESKWRSITGLWNSNEFLEMSHCSFSFDFWSF